MPQLEAYAMRVGDVANNTLGDNLSKVLGDKMNNSVGVGVGAAHIPVTVYTPRSEAAALVCWRRCAALVVDNNTA